MSEQIDTKDLDLNQESEAQLAREIESDEWLRVSPIAILYFFAKTMYFLIFNVLIYMLPIFAFNFQSVRENPLPFVAGALGLVILVLIGSIIKYLFYFYRLSSDRVEIRQGMIRKSHLDLPFSKIQNVKIIEPIYYRFSDFCIMELDTAGSAKQEANIVAIRVAMAQSFKQKIQAIVHTVSSPLEKGSAGNVINDPSSQSENSVHSLEEVTLNRRSLKDLVIHGVTNNRVWIFLGFAAPFYNVIADNIGRIFSAIGIDIASYLDYETQSMGIFLLHLLSIVMVIMLFVVLFSIIGSIFAFYDYRLSKSGERYIRRSGLLSKHEVSMKSSRIQLAVQQQDWLDILIRRVNLQFEQNSSGVPNAGQAQQINSANKLIVPSVTPHEADALVDEVFHIQKLSDVSFTAVSPRLILRLFLFPCLPIITALIALAIGADYSLKGWLGVSAAVLVLLGICVLRWWRWGFAQDEDFVYVRKGFFGRDFYAFPIDKVQQSKLLQTPFMRMRGLASMKIVLASGGVFIPYLPEQTVRGLIDKSLLRLGRDKPAWM